MKVIAFLRGNPVVEFLVIIALALALAFAVQAVVVKPYRIPTESMEPTLVPGQRVLVDRLGNDFFAPSIGDIVVFHPPVAAEEGLNGICGADQRPGEACSRPVTASRMSTTSSASWRSAVTRSRSWTAT